MVALRHRRRLCHRSCVPDGPRRHHLAAGAELLLGPGCRHRMRGGCRHDVDHDWERGGAIHRRRFGIGLWDGGDDNGRRYTKCAIPRGEHRSRCPVHSRCCSDRWPFLTGGRRCRSFAGGQQHRSSVLRVGRGTRVDARLRLASHARLRLRRARSVFLGSSRHVACNIDTSGAGSGIRIGGPVRERGPAGSRCRDRVGARGR